MSGQESRLVGEIPLAELLAPDGQQRLRFDIERMAHKFGYAQMSASAVKYGQAMVSVRFEVRQPWEPAQ